MTKDIILQAVTDTYSVSLDELLSPTRKHRIVVARQAAMYLMHHYTMLSLSEIADAVGRWDHTTILWGIDQTVRRITTSHHDYDVVFQARQTARLLAGAQ